VSGWILAVVILVKMNGATVSVHTQTLPFDTLEACNAGGRLQSSRYAPSPKDDPASVQVGWYCAKAGGAS
jgi:hypothetical protein